MFPTSPSAIASRCPSVATIRSIDPVSVSARSSRIPARLYRVSSEEANGTTRSESFRKVSPSIETVFPGGFSGISGNSWEGNPARRKWDRPEEIST